MDKYRRQAFVAALLALAGLGRARADEARTLRLGVMPVYGTRTMMSRYEPLRAYIARLLGAQTRIESAPDFQRYLRGMIAGDFDIAVAPAHFARIAQLDSGWVPLAQFSPDHDTLLITRAGEAPKRIKDIAGREVAVIDRLAITVMGALHYLERQGMKADKDYRVVEYRNHASVVHSLLAGASAMAVTTSHGLHQIPADLRTRVAVYQSVSDIPAFVISAAPRLTKAEIAKLRAGLLTFSGETEGLEFMGQNTYTGLHPANETAMRRADPYIKETRRMTGL
jgi:phosphonate transport system substrate-binding protein